MTRTRLPSVSTPVTAGACGLAPPVTTGAVAALGREVPTEFTAPTRAEYDRPAGSRVKVVARLSGSWTSTRCSSSRVIT